jgi:hypothetical protein
MNILHESIESVQDQHALLHMLTTVYSSPITDEEIEDWRVPTGLRLIRTPPICQQEMTDWTSAYEKLKKMDLCELAKKVVFEHEEDYEPPYQEYDWTTDTCGWPGNPPCYTYEGDIFKKWS